MSTITKVVVDSGEEFAIADEKAVKFEPQELTEEQKDQARENIGASSFNDASNFQEQLSEINTTIFEMIESEPSKNKFNPETLVVVSIANVDRIYSDTMIPCSVGDVIYTAGVNSSGKFEFYSSMAYLIGADGSSALLNNLYKSRTIVEHAQVNNIVGIKVVFKKSEVDISNGMMVTINEEPTAFEPYVEQTYQRVNRVQRNETKINEQQEQLDVVESRVASRWAGKNVLVLGDSISTDDYGNYTKWATVLKDMKGFNLYNYSVHAYGYVCCQSSAAQGEYNMINQIENANNEFVAQNKTPDLVILFMGTNDFSKKVPIGAKGDGMNTEMWNKQAYLTPLHTPDASASNHISTITTFYGGVEHCMARIKQLWPMAMVCVLTPLQRTNQTSTTEGTALVDYRDIIIETAKAFTFPVKDLYYEANFSPCNPYDLENKTLSVYDSTLQTYVYDGVHPNEAFCRDVLAPTIGSFIEQM